MGAPTRGRPLVYRRILTDTYPESLSCALTHIACGLHSASAAVNTSAPFFLKPDPFIPPPPFAIPLLPFFSDVALSAAFSVILRRLPRVRGTHQEPDQGEGIRRGAAALSSEGELFLVYQQPRPCLPKKFLRTKNKTCAIIVIACCRPPIPPLGLACLFCFFLFFVDLLSSSCVLHPGPCHPAVLSSRRTGIGWGFFF